MSGIFWIWFILWIFAVEVRIRKCQAENEWLKQLLAESDAKVEIMWRERQERRIDGTD